LLKCAKNYYIWSRRLKVQAKMQKHTLTSLFGPPAVHDNNADDDYVDSLSE